MDKEFWRSIANNHYQVPVNYELDQLTAELLKMLGTSDPEVRDYYIYSTLEKWIEQGLYSHAQLRALLTQLLKNLMLGLGERENDGVLLRSFSALALSDIIRYDNAHPFLEAHEVLAVLEQSITYVMGEQDLRGFDPNKGWIHALAHTGDLLGTLTFSRYLDQRELERLLTAIAEKVTVPTPYVFTTAEDERLALAVVAVLSRKILPVSYWGWWCRHMAEVEEKMHWEDIVHFARQEDINAYHNTRTFLHSLYFQLTLAGYDIPGLQELVAAIKSTLYKLDPGFYSTEVLKLLQ